MPAGSATCPSCRNSFPAFPSDVNQRVMCPRCSRVFVLKSLDGPPPEPPVVSARPTPPPASTAKPAPPPAAPVRAPLSHPVRQPAASPPAAPVATPSADPDEPIDVIVPPASAPAGVPPPRPGKRPPAKKTGTKDVGLMQVMGIGCLVMTALSLVGVGAGLFLVYSISQKIQKVFNDANAAVENQAKQAAAQRPVDSPKDRFAAVFPGESRNFTREEKFGVKQPLTFRVVSSTDPDTGVECAVRVATLPPDAASPERFARKVLTGAEAWAKSQDPEASGTGQNPVRAGDVAGKEFHFDLESPNKLILRVFVTSHRLYVVTVQGDLEAHAGIAGAFLNSFDILPDE